MKFYKTKYKKIIEEFLITRILVKIYNQKSFNIYYIYKLLLFKY